MHWAIVSAWFRAGMTTPTASITEEDAHSFEMAAGVMILITTQNRKMRVNLLSKRGACVQSPPLELFV